MPRAAAGPNNRVRGHCSSAAATLPLAGYGQDEELTDQRPTRQTDRDSLLTDPLSGCRPLSQLWGPS